MRVLLEAEWGTEFGRPRREGGRKTSPVESPESRVESLEMPEIGLDRILELLQTDL